MSRNFRCFRIYDGPALRHGLRQDLDRHFAIELGVGGAIHLAHPTLAARDSQPPTPEALSRLQAAYSPDALIQAAADRLGLTDEMFAVVLAKELYSDVMAALAPGGSIKLFQDAVTSRHIDRMTRTNWQAFIDLISFHFPDLTALRLAATLSGLVLGPVAPTTILSFNAEPLFAALINANVATKRGIKGGDALDLVVQSTSDRKASRVPYVFCHGLLPVPGTTSRTLSSVDKLAFAEAAYLQLANASFSWQSASFLRAAAGNTLVFVGVSLADPNMRRWLSWVHATRVAELTEAAAPAPTSTTHYWIAKAPGDDATERWTESLVSHLGIRVIWVHDYVDIAPTLELMSS